MVNVYIHKDFETEKKYVFDFLFKYYFKTDYNISYHEKHEYCLKFGNKRITIEDSFFFALPPNQLLNKKAIPTKAETIRTDLAPENNLKLLFGNKKTEISSDKAYIGIDLIGSIFFLLTLYEEMLSEDLKDEHSRFDESRGYLRKMKLHRNPLVNEYSEYLWNVLSYMGYKGKRISRSFKTFLTHDVDYFARYDCPSKYIKAIGGDIFRRRSLKAFYNTNKDFFGKTFKNQKDSYDTFDFLMDISDEKELKSHFYFIPGKKGDPDYRYNINDDCVTKAIKNILSRGHIVGIHPSYSTYNNVQQFNLELGRLKELHPNISEGRQHYLRFENPITWEIWDSLGLKTDSSIGYHSDVGFRAGVCCEYPVYSLTKRKQLNLTERPLIIMDGSLRKISHDKDILLETCNEVISKVKKYNGDLVILWHNNNLAVNEWEGWDKFYKQLIELC